MNEKIIEMEAQSELDEKTIDELEKFKRDYGSRLVFLEAELKKKIEKLSEM